MALPCEADVINTKSGFIDFNLYPYLTDVNSDSVFTLNLSASLNNGFSYFSLTNFSNQNNEGELGDTIAYYSEQNIRWRLGENSALDLTFQSNFRSGNDNDRHRLGVRWRLNDTALWRDVFQRIHLTYSINLHALQFDDADANIWQLEHVFRLAVPQLSDRLYIGGFIDQTYNEDLPRGFPTSPVVAEAQLGYRIIENFYVVAEYRVNDYRRSDVNNIAIGVEYLIRW